MAILVPNATTVVNGVTIREKIIPDGTKWHNTAAAQAAGFAIGSNYKANKKLSGGTGVPQYVTIHNTNDLDEVYDDGEQYTRATHNQNMGTARVHFFVDDTGVWQNLKAGTGLFDADPEGSAEVSWHSGDGSVVDGGNMTSLSIEVIMHESEKTDRIAYDNGARLAAWLLFKHGLSIDRLVTHTYWVNKSNGKTFDDVDTQCCNPIAGKKWCPTYIFNSNNPNTAKKNWKEFKAIVNGYLVELLHDEDTAFTKIMGEPVATVEQMSAYIRKKNPNVDPIVLKMIPAYLSEGRDEGVRGDFSFAQSCLETGNFTFAGSAVTLDQNNFCGMGVTSRGVKGNSFETPIIGIRAQIQHAKAYASKEDLNKICVDPRFKYVERGCAEYVEILGQKENPRGKGWATGKNYGGKILAILNAIIATKPETEQKPEEFERFLVKVDAWSLRIRKGPGTNYAHVGSIRDHGVYTIVDVKPGEGSDSGWGKLKSGAGWISLDYVTRK